MTFEEHLERWSALHGGTDPRGTPFVLGWLRLVHVLGARLRVNPNLITALSVVAAALVLTVPPWAGALLVVLSSVCDGLDGAVAVLQDRVTRLGARLDAIADRLCDLLFVLALVVAGAPWWLGAAVAVAILVLEGSRIVVGRPLAITVAERPTRVIATAVGLVSVPTIALVVLLLATAVGVAQLAAAYGRGMTPPRGRP